MKREDKLNLIHKEWRNFISGMSFSNDGILPKVILDSWHRCRSNNVNAYLTKVPLILSDLQIKELLANNRELIEVSVPVMKNLYSFVEGSGFVVGMFDRNGYLLHFVGDEDVREDVKRGNFYVGSCWSEEIAGTNGVGTVIHEDKPLQVYASEHYCIVSQKWSCSGAPIHDSEGKLIGVIDMVGPHQKTNAHTLGMVVASAYAIENEFRLGKLLSEYKIAESFQRTVISSFPEIIMTIDNKGLLSMLNKNAQKAFGMDGGSLGKRIEDFCTPENKGFLNLINTNGSVIDAEVRIYCDKGQRDYTISCYPIMSDDTMTGKIITLNEIKRARSLVTKMIGAKAKLSFEDIIGTSPEFKNTVKLARIASRNKSNVILLGESGTGKDIFAQAIHNDSDRSNGPYVAINCAAIPRDLIMSELFGYYEGAFTGSKKGGNQGKFELADGGTIFLDEIGETPLEMQAALLRVIEDKSIIRIGGSKVTTVDVRIITATNKNLKEEVQKGKFREDLYYRLNVFSIWLLPLRKRKDDIPALVDSFTRKFSESMHKKIERIHQDVMEAFVNYNWPGNVRELQNVLERMINIAPGAELTVDLLPSEIIHSQSEGEDNISVRHKFVEGHESLDKLLDSNLPKKEIAKRLGISRSTLYRKLDERKLP